MTRYEIPSTRAALRSALVAATGLLASIAISGCDSDDSGKARAAAMTDAVMPPSGPLGAQVRGQPLPPEVGLWVQAVRRECAEARGRWGGIADFILPGDFNGDGRTDYIVMRQGLTCSSTSGDGLGPLEQLWGNAGPGNDFIVSQPGGGYRTYDGFAVPELTRDNIIRRGNRDVVALEGRWFRAGGEVHKVIWGWTAQGPAVIERQDAQGRPVDEDGYRVQAAAPNAGGALPFREGVYAHTDTPCGDEGAVTRTITASTFTTNTISDEEPCRIESRQVNGARVQLTVRCEIGCGNAGDGPCPTQYDRPQTMTIHAESPTMINITGANQDWNGRHRYCHPVRR